MSICINAMLRKYSDLISSLFHFTKAEAALDASVIVNVVAIKRKLSSSIVAENDILGLLTEMSTTIHRQL